MGDRSRREGGGVVVRNDFLKTHPDYAPAFFA